MSKHLPQAKLEKDFGVPLFNREGRQIRLNSYGDTFLKKVETTLNALEEGKREVTDMANIVCETCHGKKNVIYHWLHEHFMISSSNIFLINRGKSAGETSFTNL